MSIELYTYVETPEVSFDESRKVLVMANMKAPVLKPEKERPPVSISAVIDKSGSMQGEKLELTKETLKFVAGNLNENDEFGIISYATDVAESLKLTKMDADGRRLALEAIDSIRATSNTNLSGGLIAGIKQLKGLPVCNRSMPEPAPVHLGQLELEIGTECTMDADGMIGNEWKLFVRLGQKAPGDITHYVALVQCDILKEGSSIPQLVTVEKAPFELTRVDRPISVTVHIRLTTKFGCGTFAFPCSLDFTVLSNANTHFIPLNVTSDEGSGTIASQTAAPNSSPERNDVCAVWLFTDGLANEGIRDRNELSRETKKQVQGMSPSCSIFTFGLGHDHDAQLLKEVADAGKGIYYYIKDKESISKGFADCLGGLFSVVAKSITLIAAVTEPGYTIQRVITKFDKQEAPNVARVMIPDLYSEEERDILILLELPKLSAPQRTSQPVMQFLVKYQNLQLKQPEKAEESVMLSRPKVAKKARMHPNMEKQHHRVLCTEAIEEAKRLADADKLMEARKKIQEVVQLIERSATAADPFNVTLINDLQSCLSQLRDRRSYRTEGTYQMVSTISSHSYQRSSLTSPAYCTQSKLQMHSMVQTIRSNHATL